MMRHLVSVLLIGAVIFAPLSSSHARGLRSHPFFIERISWFSLAVSNFAAATPELEETAAEITRSIRGVLSRSGPYPFAQSEDLNSIPVGIDTPSQFSLWTPHGVELLLVGRVSVAPDGRLEVALRLWDTVTQAQVTGRRYLAPTESKDRLALTVAGEIFEALGDRYESALSRIRDR
jgi:TolB protein